MFIYLLIALGGALGSITRHWLTETVAARLDGPFPWGTFLVNITGCLLIGLFATLPGGGRQLSPRAWACKRASAWAQVPVSRLVGDMPSKRQRRANAASVAATRRSPPSACKRST